MGTNPNRKSCKSKIPAKARSTHRRGIGRPLPSFGDCGKCDRQPIVSTTSLNSNGPTSSSYAGFDLSTFASAEELRQYLIDQAVAQYSYLFGTHFVPYRGIPLGGGIALGVFQDANFAAKTLSATAVFDGQTNIATGTLSSPSSPTSFFRNQQPGRGCR